MIQSHTTAIVAPVQNKQTGRNWTVIYLPGDPVRPSRSVAYSKHAIPSDGMTRGDPLPTPFRLSRVNRQPFRGSLTMILDHSQYVRISVTLPPSVVTLTETFSNKRAITISNAASFYIFHHTTMIRQYGVQE